MQVDIIEAINLVQQLSGLERLNLLAIAAVKVTDELLRAIADYLRNLKSLKASPLKICLTCF